MKKLGILGGTFNPPHIGHIYIAERAKTALGLERVLFIPCGNPPHKTVEGEVDASVRLDMVALAIKQNPEFEICDIETKSAEKSYTANTLKRLSEMYPETELFFIVGADSLDYLENWYHPEEIFSLAHIVAVSRSGLDDDAICARAQAYRDKYNAEITFIEADTIDISSSEIRTKIRLGENVTSYVGKSVLEYIKQNKIYEEA